MLPAASSSDMSARAMEGAGSGVGEGGGVTCEVGVREGGEAEAADVAVVQGLGADAVQDRLHEVPPEDIVALASMEGALGVDVKHAIAGAVEAVVVQQLQGVPLVSGMPGWVGPNVFSSWGQLKSGVRRPENNTRNRFYGVHDICGFDGSNLLINDSFRQSGIHTYVDVKKSNSFPHWLVHVLP
jgi:hypothetical protein